MNRTKLGETTSCSDAVAELGFGIDFGIEIDRLELDGDASFESDENQR